MPPHVELSPEGRHYSTLLHRDPAKRSARALLSSSYFNDNDEVVLGASRSNAGSTSAKAT